MRATYFGRRFVWVSDRLHHLFEDGRRAQHPAGAGPTPGEVVLFHELARAYSGGAALVSCTACGGSSAPIEMGSPLAFARLRAAAACFFSSFRRRRSFTSRSRCSLANVCGFFAPILALPAPR